MTRSSTFRLVPTLSGVRHLLAVLLLTAGAQAAAAEKLSLQATSAMTEWTFSYKGQPLMVYSFEPGRYKPYVKELHTLGGLNVLRDSPSDHLHHHALMYGIRVNGANFWEERAGAGVQRVVRSVKPELSSDPAGRPQARFSQTIHWVIPDDAFLPAANSTPLLIEQRTLTLVVDEAGQEVALHWKSQFEVGNKTNTVELAGANYHGLGMRFMEELDPLAAHLNSGGAPDLAAGKQNVSRHAWGSVSFQGPGKSAHLVLAGHPSNAGGEAAFFTMRTPFAYLSATQELDRTPLVYHAGDKFELNYLVTLYPAPKTAASIDERIRRWTSAKPE